MSVPGNPVALFNSICVETHNTCNRTCWFCKFDTANEREPKSLMSWELIEKIVSNLKELKFDGRLSWYRINEPLIDKRIFKILSFSKSHLPEVYLSLVTNGDLLTPEKVAQLFDSGLDCLGISIYDEGTRIKCQGSEYKRCILIDRRPKQEPFFVDNRGGNVRREEKLDNSNPKVNIFTSNCLRPSTMVNIVSNGDVVLCCSDLFGKFKAGSVVNEKIETIWYGKVLNDYRNHLSMQGRKGLEPCENCSFHGGGHTKEYPKNNSNRLVKDR